ncbi:hypothetical protein [Streptomyces sp. NPDC002671]
MIAGVGARPPGAVCRGRIPQGTGVLSRTGAGVVHRPDAVSVLASRV